MTRLADSNHGGSRDSASGMTRDTLAHAALLQKFRDHAGPAGLVAGAKPEASVAVEIFVKKNKFFSVWVRAELFLSSDHGALTLVIPQEEFGETPGKFCGDVP